MGAASLHKLSISSPRFAAPGAHSLWASVASHAGSTYAWTVLNGSITSGQGTCEIAFTAGSAGTTVIEVVETSDSADSSTGQARVAIVTPPPQDWVLRFVDASMAQESSRSPLLDAKAPYTLEAWVYLESASGCGTIMGKRHDGADPYVAFVLDVLEGRPRFLQSAGTPGSYREAVGPRVLPLGVWIHLAGVQDGATMRLLVNGSEVATAESPESVEVYDAPFAIGASVGPDGSYGGFQLDGSLRQLRVWNRARGGVEVAADAGEALTGNEEGLIACWPLDDGHGLSARELGPGRLDLTLGAPENPWFAPEWATRRGIDQEFFREERYPVALGSAYQPTPYLSDIYPFDFDSDGDVDLLVPTTPEAAYPAKLAPLLAFRNDGTGAFSDATTEVLGLVELQWPRNHAVADLNGDGRMDIVIADHGTDTDPFPGGQSRVLVQTAAGTLRDETASSLPAALSYTHSLAAADVDGDGDVDVYMNNTCPDPIGPTLYLNDGRGHFVASTAGLPPAIAVLERPSLSCVFADIDRDGDPDLYLGGHNQIPWPSMWQDGLLLNDSAGHFTLAPEPALPPRIRGPEWGVADAVAGDFDRDGWTDFLLAAFGPEYVGSEMQLLLNNRNGSFRDGTLKIHKDAAWSGSVARIAVADFNSDGWLDFATPSAWTDTGEKDPNRLFLNMGDGTFSDATSICPVHYDARVARAVDLNRDGRPDLVLVSDAGFRVLTNLKSYAPVRSRIRKVLSQKR